MSTKRFLCQRKTEDGLENKLANPWSGKKITQEFHAGRGVRAQMGNPESKLAINLLLNRSHRL
jgi:hypothetical protein